MTGKNTSAAQAPADKAVPDLAAVLAAVEKALAAQSAAEAAAKQAGADREAAEAAARQAAQSLDAAVEAAKQAAEHRAAVEEAANERAADLQFATADLSLVAAGGQPLIPTLTAAEAVLRVKRTVVYQEKGASRKVTVPIRVDEVLSVKDHGTHITVVTTDGQKFTDAPSAD